MRIWSTAFADGDTIPVKYTCDGENISPPLGWEAVPQGAASFVLVADDPDAPRGTWVHWVVYDLPGDTRTLPEGGPLPGGSQGVTDFRQNTYGGPCPPPGKAHRYFFKLYALDIPSLGLPEGADKAQVESAMQGHILAQAQTIGRYGR